MTFKTRRPPLNLTTELCQRLKTPCIPPRSKWEGRCTLASHLQSLHLCTSKGKKYHRAFFYARSVQTPIPYLYISILYPHTSPPRSQRHPPGARKARLALKSPVPTQSLQVIVLQLVRRSIFQLPGGARDFECGVGMSVRGAAQTGIALIVQLAVGNVEMLEELRVQRPRLAFLGPKSMLLPLFIYQRPNHIMRPFPPWRLVFPIHPLT